MDMKINILNHSILNYRLTSQHYTKEKDEGIDTSMFDDIL
jgi:hypothetical protein